MNRKLIFFDIDGTLISGGTQKMPDSAISAIQKARENGHICVINTGRTKAIVGDPITGQVQFDGLLLGCGTMILYHDVELLHHTFTAEQSAKIMEGLKRYEFDALLEGKSNIFSQETEAFHTEQFYRYVERLRTHHHLEKWDTAFDHFDKLFGYQEKEENIRGFAKEFEDIVDTIDRENGYYEMVPKGYSKATGMQFLADWLQIDMKDTVAIGDSNNDIPMLSCAGVGIAMGKSSEELLAMADYVTTDVQDDGIWNALQWLGVLE